MKLFLFILPPLVILIPCEPARAELFDILTSEVPPMAFTENGKLTGYCTEITEEIQRRLHDKNPIESIPWGRAYKMGLEQPRIMLDCPKRTPEREKLFKWVGPVVESSTNLYRKRGTIPGVNSLAEARKVPSVLVPRGFYSIQQLQNLGFTNLEIVADSEMAVRMVLRGRGSLIALDRLQIPTALKQVQEPLESLESIARVGPSNGYFAFSRDISDKTIRTWQKTLGQLRANGFLKRAYRKWFEEKSR